MTRYIIICLLYFLPLFLAAQNIDSLSLRDTLISHPLAEVVISANRFNSIRFNTPEAIKVLNSKSVEEFQLRTAPEALLLTPGVFVQKTNHGGGSPFLRGLTGNQTLLLIDGIRLSNSTMRYGPNQYFNTIDIFSIEKMEVLRGSGSVQYGTDALGGTIQVFTNDLLINEKADWGITLLTRAATHGMEQSLRTGFSFANRYAAFRTGLTWRNFGDLEGGDTTGRQIPSGYHELDFDIKGKIFFSPVSSITLAFQNVRQQDIPVYHKIALENYAIYRTDPQSRRLTYVRYIHQLETDILKSVTLTASYHHTGERREIRRNDSDMLRTEYDKVQSLGFSAEAFMSSGNLWSSTTGIEAYSDLVNSTRTDTDLTSDIATEMRGLYPDDATMNSLAAFTVHSIDVRKWNFTAGTRYNAFIIDVEDETIGKTHLKPSVFVANLAMMRKLNSKSNLFASINTGFRAPNIDDLGTLGIVDFRYETPDFNLKPERSLQYQIGYKYQDNKLRGDLFIYRNNLYNLIVRKRIEGQYVEGYPVYQKENSDRAFIHGLETAWDFMLNPSWIFYGSLTYTYGQNITQDEPMRRIPPLFGRLAVDYKFKRLLINLEWQAAGTQDRLAPGDIDDNRIPEGGTPGWNIVNVNAEYTRRFFDIDLSLKNIFNRDYRFHGSGINGIGRSAFLTVIVNI